MANLLTPNGSDFHLTQAPDTARFRSIITEGDTMKLTVLAAVAVLALAGCSSASTAAPKTTGTEAQYLTIMNVVWPGASDASVITLGHTVCQSLDLGQTPDQVAATLLTTGEINEAGTRVLLRASVVTYCPTHEDVVPAQQ